MAKTKEELLQEEMDKERAERETERAEQQKVIEGQRKSAEEARERAAKAEGAIEALKSFQTTTVSSGGNQWTEEQWTKWEEETGMKRSVIIGIDNAVTAKIKDVETKFEERARKAEERAKAAEEKYQQHERGRDFEKQTREYISKKPHFAKYEKEFNEFVSEFPEESRKDPARLAKIFEKAEVYIKGKVSMEKPVKRTPGGSDRFGSDEETDVDEETKPDLSDLRAHERLVVERIVTSKEKNDELKKYRHDLKGDDGVMISGKHDWDKYNKKDK